MRQECIRRPSDGHWEAGLEMSISVLCHELNKTGRVWIDTDKPRVDTLSTQTKAIAWDKWQAALMPHLTAAHARAEVRSNGMCTPTYGPRSHTESTTLQNHMCQCNLFRSHELKYRSSRHSRYCMFNRQVVLFYTENVSLFKYKISIYNNVMVFHVTNILLEYIFKI